MSIIFYIYFTFGIFIYVWLFLLHDRSEDHDERSESCLQEENPQGQISVSQPSVLQSKTKVQSDVDEPRPNSCLQKQPTVTSKKQKGHHLYGYNKAWEKTYPWLLLTPEENGMLCCTCQTHGAKKRNGSTKWTEIPCQTLRVDAVKEHEKSSAHQTAAKQEKLRLQASIDGGVLQAFEDQIMWEKRAIIAAMKTLLWLSKEEIPHTTKFSSLLDLARQMGCDYLLHLGVPGTAGYRSERSVQEFLNVMAETVRKPLMEEVMACDYIGLMADESTDQSNLKQLSIVLRYTSKGQVKNVHLGLTDLRDGTAPTVTSTIKEQLKDAGIPLEKVASFGSDGAATFTGRHNGVAKKLRDEVPYMTSIHCINHREALGIVDASKQVKYIHTVFKPNMRHLFNYFDNSPVRTACLKEVQEMLDEPKLYLVDAVDTRWLSTDQACRSLHRCLPSVLSTLGNEAAQKANPVAIGLNKILGNYMFVATLHLMCDVLPLLSRLSKVFQTATIDICQVRPQLNACLDRVKALLETPGPIEATLDDLLKKMPGVSVPENAHDKFEKQVRRPFLEAILTCLPARFPDVPLLEAFNIFDPVMVNTPVAGERLEILSEHYCKGPSPILEEVDVLRSEWDMLAEYIKRNLANENATSVMSQLVGNPTLCFLYPNLARLSQVGLTMPASTAGVERLFSTMKRIKTPLCNRLKNKTLNDLILLSLHSPNLEEFDFETSVELWSKIRKRKINLVG